MNITLTAEMEKRIKEKVQRGEFESADAIVEQAVSFFLDYEEEEMDGQELQDTAMAIEEALRQAERGEGISLEDFDRKMRTKHGIQR
jgi:Arc/MetJ-type ribon-helix-helix transcriptional regulator